ncbi:hypothetical protein QJS04_geneDACA006561 [Acorus gramineus]|uniref:TF-B3 domain-containing protein n=1 Tax=Acorus gramineus TaxID=55184 RepID=A0AAV9AW15_ACOGR|nr:hypothetical protein QJS04_geneDACA006561 [Acorus gramineus]
MMLRYPKERLWEFQIYYRCRNKNWSQFRGQWHEFVIAIGLQSGDVCVFELIGCGEKDVLNVRILNGQSVKNNDSEEFKTKVEASTHSYDCEIKLKKQVARCLQQKDATKEENVLPQSTRRCFKVSINPFNLLLPYMNIPHEFIESNGLQHTCKVRMTNANGRSWEVSILHRQNDRSRFTGGWQKFIDSNGFGVGEVLVFEIDPDDKDII